MTRNPVVHFAALVFKTLAFWIVLLATSMLAYRLVPVSLPPPPAHDGPFTVEQAILVVNMLLALVLTMVAARANVRGWRLGLLLFVALFFGGSFIMQLDTMFFMRYVALPLTNAIILKFILQAAIAAAVAAIVGALMFRPEVEPTHPVPATMTGRVGATALLYVFLYWSAGALIAWASAAVRAHYGQGMQFNVLELASFQVFRGLLWTLTALFVVARLKGSLASRALVMGVLFAILTNTGMLYPNAGLTWDVRQVHLVEVAVSEFLYGFISTFILLGGARRALAASSPWRLITGPA